MFLWARKWIRWWKHKRDSSSLEASVRADRRSGTFPPSLRLSVLGRQWWKSREWGVGAPFCQSQQRNRSPATSRTQTQTRLFADCWKPTEGTTEELKHSCWMNPNLTFSHPSGGVCSVFSMAGAPPLLPASGSDPYLWQVAFQFIPP